MTKTMWGGRFSEGPDAIMQEINASIDFDKALFAEDIAGSKAHAQMLADQGIISAEDAKQIVAGLDTIAAEISAGKFTFSRALEDIHTHVEARLGELIGTNNEFLPNDLFAGCVKSGVRAASSGAVAIAARGWTPSGRAPAPRRGPAD